MRILETLSAIVAGVTSVKSDDETVDKFQSKPVTESRTLDDLKATLGCSSLLEVLKVISLPELVSSLRWETRMSQHFLLHYYIDFHDEDDALFSSLLEASEQIYEQLMEFFHIEARSKQESLVLQTRIICFIVKIQSKETVGWGGPPLFYCFDSKQNPEYMKHFRHEIAHNIWSNMYGEAPSLFNEGVAVYADRMSLPDADVSDFLCQPALCIEKIPPICEIAVTENFWKYDSTMMYRVGGLWSYFLVQKWGWERLKSLFLISDYEDVDIVKHFGEVYGQKMEEVDLEWREFLRSKRRGM